MIGSTVISSSKSKLKNFFLDADSSGLLSIVNITSVIYIIVLGLTFKDFYAVMANWVVAFQAIGVSIIIGNMFLLYRSKNVPLSASIMLFCILVIHLVNVTFAGGIDTVHFAWIFIIPILAGGTMGWRGQLFFWLMCVLGTIFYAVFPENLDALPYEGSMGYTLMTRLMCLTIFSLIMLIYYFVLNDKMLDINKALSLACFESNLFMGVFNSNVQSVILVDVKGNIERANAKAHKTFGYKKDALLDSHIGEICQTSKTFSYDSLDDINGKEILITSNDGHALWLEYSSLRVADENNEQHILLTIEDISERKNHESELSYLAHYDYLTKLPNRLFIQQRMGEMVEKGQLQGRKFSIVFIDLDKFKNVNDIKGHEAGDAVLIEVAKRIKKVVPKSDVVARFGGDEFVLLLNDVTDEKQIIRLIETLQNRISHPIMFGENEYFIGSSVGVSQFPKDSEEVNELLRKADTAMYKAKSLATGSYQFYNVVHDDSIKRIVKLGSELNYAVERDELRLVFQPIYDQNDAISGAEALIRWEHPELGNIPPDEFIPLSEDNGLIVPIGLWVLDQACNVLKQWHIMGFTHLTMSINVSYRQINNDDLVNELVQTLKKYDLPGSSIVLELTERVFADDLSLVQNNILQFSQLGVDTAIDDFGVGYSSLSYLKKTDFSSIKIDRSFVKDIETNTSARNLCAAIMSMASSLGLSVTAEGIEEKEHLSILKEMKINKYQGYYMSKPITAKDFEALLIK
ncbi:EAL domain-containing protein [uncultured Paraglaciecola sp.]|uniref:sensor domain-containing protein n=1 Tax=uncultured Paraglaciecola sp. TaxID=1765024 RepID=UPI0025D855FD|nr:EAL domain-containing protein [uncultured Paraglaciecola sp.]